MEIRVILCVLTAWSVFRVLTYRGKNVEAIAEVLADVKDWEGLANWLDIEYDYIKEDCKQYSRQMMCYRRELVRRYCEKHSVDLNKAVEEIANALDRMDLKRLANKLRKLQLDSGTGTLERERDEEANGTETIQQEQLLQVLIRFMKASWIECLAAVVVIVITTYTLYHCTRETPLEQYASYLKKVYTNKSDSLPTYDKWPQVKGKKFINLSLLSKCNVSPQEAHKYTEAMFHGDISSIDPEKKMEMADIAMTEDGSIIKGRRRCILVEGAPGVGKSTFAWKLCRQWGKAKILQQYRLVVLLRLREKKVREAKEANDLFRRCKPTAIEEIRQSGGEGVLLVLDGWDELPAELRGKGSFFLNLVQGQVLPDATVVVTSRPHASEMIVTECQDHIFQHIEIMGFSEDNVRAYMTSNAGDDAKLLQGLQTYTSCYPHIRSMMYNPLNAAIVVKVYKDSQEEGFTIPKTMTELYSSLIRTLLLRYLRDHPDHHNQSLRQFSDLPPDVYQRLREVSSVAYNGMKNNQQVIFNDLPDKFDSLDLMQCVPELYVDKGAALSYNFLHFTVQEFLAAFHLSQQSTEEQIELFGLNQKTCTYKMVMKFLAGLTNFKGFSANVLLSVLTGQSQTSSGIQLDLDCLHFLFEGKESNKVFKMLSDLSEVSFRSSPSLSLFDCYVLGYIASHTRWKWTIHVVYAPYNVVEMFAKGTIEDRALRSSVPDTVNLTFSNSLHSTSGLQQLLTAHPSFLTRTRCLHLMTNHLDHHSCDLLSRSLQSFPHLQSLDLSYNGIGTMFSPHHLSVQLIRALHRQNTLKSLKLRCTAIGQPECVALAQWLSHCTCSLEVLDIAENNLTSDTIKPIITNLCKICTLRELDISDLKEFCQLMGDVFRLPLVKLHLQWCNIHPEEACEIAKMVYNNSVFEELYLLGNPIGYEGAKPIVDMLRHNKTLKILDLRQASLTAQDTQKLRQSLQHSGSLCEVLIQTTNRDRASSNGKMFWR